MDIFIQCIHELSHNALSLDRRRFFFLLQVVCFSVFCYVWNFLTHFEVFLQFSTLQIALVISFTLRIFLSRYIWCLVDENSILFLVQFYCWRRRVYRFSVEDSKKKYIYPMPHRCLHCSSNAKIQCVTDPDTFIAWEERQQIRRWIFQMLIIKIAKFMGGGVV